MKVICIEDYNNGGWLPKDYSLTKGQLYHIKELGRYSYNKLRKMFIKEFPDKHLHNPHTD